MKKLFKNIAKSAKSAAINCQTSIAAPSAATPARAISIPLSKC